MQRSLPCLALFALALGPELASACAVCSAGRDDESRFAFLMMTIFMSVTPLALIGGLVYWIRRRHLALEAREEGAPSTPHPARQNS
jgi:hypothetical protein